MDMGVEKEVNVDMEEEADMGMEKEVNVDVEEKADKGMVLNKF